VDAYPAGPPGDRQSTDGSTRRSAVPAIRESQQQRINEARAIWSTEDALLRRTETSAGSGSGSGSWQRQRTTPACSPSTERARLHRRRRPHHGGGALYYTVFPPALPVLLLMLLGRSSIPRTSRDAESQIRGLMGPEGSNQIRPSPTPTLRLRQCHHDSAGVVALVLGATGVFGQLQAALNRLGGPDRSRGPELRG
jgi:hypothetical protein